MNRRQFLRSAALAAASGGVLSACSSAPKPRPVVLDGPPFRISLAQWSLHRSIREKKTLTTLDFPVVAKRDYQIEGVEYVNQLFENRRSDAAYLGELKNRCDSEGVTSVLIMCDGDGNLGDPDEAKRRLAVSNHHKWADAAKFLGCHSIRVNAYSSGTFEEQQKLAADGLRGLCDYAAKLGLNVIVENHGGFSSNGKWLSGVVRMVGMTNAGTLPDFGNFYDYDRYIGVTEMMPFAKGVSAKTNDFDYDGEETKINYRRMIEIVWRAGYRGWIGVEYEGAVLPEPNGIRATKRLLEKHRDELTARLRAGVEI